MEYSAILTLVCGLILLGGCTSNVPVDALTPGNVKAIYVCVNKEYFYLPTKHLDKYYAITDKKEIDTFTASLNLKECNYVTQCTATNRILFALKNDAYLTATFIESEKTMPIGTIDGKLFGEFKISGEAIMLLKGYIEKAQQLSNKLDNEKK